MLLARRERRIRAAAHGLECRGDRHGVLLGIPHPRDAADRIRVSLADAAPPERVVCTVREHCIRIDAREREHAWIPADRDHTDVPCRLCRRIHRRIVRRDIGVRIKAVHHVEKLRELRGLLRKIGRRAAAEDEHIHLVLPLCRLRCRHNRHLRARLHRRGIAARKYSGQLHVRIGLDGVLHAASEIAITKNTNANHISSLAVPRRHRICTSF